MKRRLLSIILAISFILFGCGSGVETEVIESEEVTVSTGEVPEEKEESPREEQNSSEEIPSQEEDEPEQIVQESMPVNVETIHVPAPEPEHTPHTCTWDSGTVITGATCNSEGVKKFTCTGCGNIRTEDIAKTSHAYVTESTIATCVEAGKTKTYCAICGSVQSESVGETEKGHTPGEKSYWPVQPSCNISAYYNISCNVCGELLESGNEEPLPHTEVTTIRVQPNCRSLGSASIDCGVCGIHLRNQTIEPTNDHNWVSTEYDVFNMETLEWDKVPGEYCTVCNRQK